MSKPNAIERIIGALTPDVASSIAAKLDKARADHTAAEKQHRTDALEAATGVSGAAARLEASTAAVRAAEQRIRDLTAAQAEAETQRRANDERTKAAEHAARVAAVRKALKESEEDAQAVEKLIEQLAATWVRLRQRRTVAVVAAKQRLDGLYFDEFSIARALSVQIDRVNASLEPRDRLPGGVTTNAASPINPELVAQGFADKLRQANARALALVEGKVAS